MPSAPGPRLLWSLGPLSDRADAICGADLYLACMRYCARCDNIPMVCEAHPDRPWIDSLGGFQCRGAGKHSLVCNNHADEDTEPELQRPSLSISGAASRIGNSRLGASNAATLPRCIKNANFSQKFLEACLFNFRQTARIANAQNGRVLISELYWRSARRTSRNAGLIATGLVLPPSVPVLRRVLSLPAQNVLVQEVRRADRARQ